MDISKALTLAMLKRQNASLSGLAPFARESGKWKGSRFFGGGQKFLREAHYMPAIIAMRFNPDMKKISTTQTSAKAIKTSPHRNHAKTHRAGKCACEKGENMGQ